MMLILSALIVFFAVLTAFSDRALRTLEEIPRSDRLSLIQTLMIPYWYAWPLLFVQSKLLQGVRSAYRRFGRI